MTGKFLKVFVDKRVLLIIMLNFMLKLSSFSQIYLKNGDFEDVIKCPTEPGEIALCAGWNGNEQTPDYFNVCSKSYNSIVGAPRNYAGCLNPYSGNGYAGIVLLYYNKLFNNKVNYRINEVIYKKLENKMNVNKKYKISLMMAKPDSGSLSIDSIYISFSAKSPVYSNNKLIESYYSKGVNISYIGNKWAKVEFYFVPKFEFLYVYIGLPRKKIAYSLYKNIIHNNCKKEKVLSYYYLDDFTINEYAE